MIDEILDQMTLEEQVSLLSGEDFWTTAAVARLGVPKIKFTDGPNGARGAGTLTGGVKAACFPAGIALGASWNPDLVEQMGASLARQAKSKGASVLLAPTVNIHRTGLNGRGFECYSEDPHLTSETAVAYIRGVQSQKVAASIKHFAGNESEIDRQTMSSDIDERTLREIYLQPFERAVKDAGVMAIMASYNRLNGVYTSENGWLLTTVLRDGWGFDGVVMSDWFGSHTTVEAIEAGLDMEMPGPTRDRGAKLVQAVTRGEVAAGTVRAAARRVLTLLERVGAFAEAPDMREHAIDLPTDRELIRRLAVEGAVLLKNEGVLPLDRADLKKIAVIGPNADVAHVTGGGSAQINAHYRVSPLEGIRHAVSRDCEVHYVPGGANNRLVRVVTGEVTVEYFQGQNCEGTPVHVETAETSEFLWFDLPHPALSPIDFSVRIAATYVPAEDGEHVFGLTNAGFAKLFVDGELVIDGHNGWTRGENYFGTANTEKRAVRTLRAARKYRVVIEYVSKTTVTAGVNLAGVRFGIERPCGTREIEEAVRIARDADVAVLFVGRNGEWDTEGLDLPNLRLPGRQEALIERVAEVNRNTVVVLQTGGPVEMPWLDSVRAVLQIWYPGQELGHVAADILFGSAEPGGRLPLTFPKFLEDGYPIHGNPSIYPGVGGHVRYDEGVFVGYRHYVTRSVKPLFPFGFGLSYTRFEWGQVSIDKCEMDVAGITVAIDVTNVGERLGSEVVQLYVRPLVSDVARPAMELRAFAKLTLHPGMTGRAVMTIGPRDLSYFSIERRTFQADAGDYEVLLAANANDVRRTIRIFLGSTWLEKETTAGE
ncbi:beta-glucosidase [Burkholderia cepacia]|nr:beta-glucosidase [Burkholderia cepacia]